MNTVNVTSQATAPYAYDAAHALTALAAFVDGALADETTSRQYIAEQASSQIKDCALAIYGDNYLRHEAGERTLTGGEIRLVRRALGDADDYQLQLACGYCRDCDKAPDGLCPDHADVLAVRNEYSELARRLGGAL